MENNRSIKKDAAISPQQLRKVVDYTKFEFETTEQVPELTNIVGQERGRAAMKFGLNVNKMGYHIYVSGIAGTGKTTFTHSIVKEFANKETELHDWCYVHNFEDGYKPNVLKLPAGLGKKLQHDMEKFIQNLKADIPRAFNEESYQKERASILRNFQEQSSKILEKLNEVAKEHGFIIRQSGSNFITLPTIDGKPINEKDYRKLGETEIKKIEEKSNFIQEKVLELTKEIRALEKNAKDEIEALDHKVALNAAGYHLDELKETYKKCANVISYLNEVQKDILNNIGDFLQEEAESANPLDMLRRGKGNDFSKKYIVNLIVDNTETKGAPVITADNPNYYNLIGKVEYESRMGVMSTDFTKIKPGYLHHANGGYLIIQAKDIFSNPYAWEGLKRALKSRKLQIENLGEHAGLIATTSIDPDPIPIDVKVIIIGNLEIYHLLYYYDEDFSKLFKIKADFDIEMDHTLENMSRLASFINTHCKEEGLRAFDRTAVAKMAEYSTRLVGHQGKLSTKFNQQVEIIYEADAWASLMGDEIVTAKHVTKAIEEKRYRSSLYEEKLQESIDEGTILIDTDGKKIGQVNGLAVYQAGQHSFGKPTRITASTFVGKSGIINIERESKLSGNIHNKGVYILGGYLGQKFAQEQPLSVTAHLAFEQSYGGVDGDSASSTELYALLSSLAEVPIDQSLAVTGSINQKGEIQPIGGVNEKIEGFFDVCKSRGLTGKQGVLIPHQNVKNLMLKDEVVEAVKNGKFHVYEVKTVEEGIEILTGMPAGQKNEHGQYEENTVYRKAADKLNRFLEIAKKQNEEKDQR